MNVKKAFFATFTMQHGPQFCTAGDCAASNGKPHGEPFRASEDCKVDGCLGSA
jgi:hypothetical protein